MNTKPKFKKFVLSALLLSAIVVPTAVGAAEESAVIPVPNSVVAMPVVSLSIMGSPNPLVLAKTYAPTTVEDWKKTLEQYNKITGNIEFEMIESFEMTPTALVGDEDGIIIDMGQAGIEFDHISEIDLGEPLVDNSAFANAKISLTEAVESDKAPAIKDALAELLVQYKQQIADFELAK